MGFWEWLFGGQETRRQGPVLSAPRERVFQHLIYVDENEELALNRWYRRARWQNKRYTREIAAQYADVELMIVPSSAFLLLPGSGLNLGVKVTLLVRSVSYRKRHNLP